MQNEKLTKTKKNLIAIVRADTLECFEFEPCSAEYFVKNIRNNSALLCEIYALETIHEAAALIENNTFGIAEMLEAFGDHMNDDEELNAAANELCEWYVHAN